MAITRIKNNQITDTTIVASEKLVNKSVTSGKLEDNLTYGSNLTVTGNLTVNGSTTTVNSTTVTVDDPMLLLAPDATGLGALDLGFIGERGDDTNIAFVWDESADEFVAAFTSSADSSTTVTITDYANLRVGGLAVDDNATIGGTLGVTGAVTLSDDISAVNITATGTLDVTGVATLSSNATVGGTLGVTGATTLSSTLGVTGATTLSSTLAVTGATTLTGLLNANGGIAVDTSNFTVNGTTGAVATASTLDVDGAATFNGAVTLGNAALDTITITGTATFAQSADFDGGFTVAGLQTVSMGSNAITNVADPSNAQDAATKNYVDTALQAGFTITDGTTPQTIDIAANDTLTFSGTANETTVAVSATDTVTVGLPDNVIITNNLTVTNDLTVSNNTTLSGTLGVVGAATFDGNVTLGDAATDTVTITADVASNIIPSIDSTYNLGGTSDRWATVYADDVNAGADLTVGGNATITGNLTVNGTTTTVDTTNLTVADSLIELGTGTTAAANDSGIVIERGLTGNNAIFVWDESADGFIVGTTTATGASTGDLIITAADFTAANITAVDVTMTGNIQAVNATFSGTLGVTGVTTLSDALNVTGLASLDGGIDVDGAFTVGDGNGNIVTTGTLDVDGATNLNGTLTVDGATALDGGITVDTTAFIVANTSGNVTTAGTLDVAGLASLDGGIDVDGAFTVADSTGNTVVGGTLDVTGAVNLNATTGSTSTTTGALIVDGGAGIAENLYVGGNTNVAGTFDVTGQTELASLNVEDLTDNRIVIAGSDGELEDDANFTFDGTTFVVGSSSSVFGVTAASGNTTVGGTLTVTGNATFNGNVDLQDSDVLNIGTGDDFTIVHDGTNTAITNSTGLLTIDGTASSAIRVNEAGADVDFIVEGDTKASLFKVDAGTDTVVVGDGTASAGATLKVDATDSFLVASGTTAQRPGTGVAGMMRWNTTNTKMEYHDGSEWKNMTADFTVIVADSFNGDGSTVAFTLSNSGTTATTVVSINGVVQVPTTAYAVSGTTLTFTEAPASGDVIDARSLTTTSSVTGLDDGGGNATITANGDGTLDVLGDLQLTAQGDLRFMDSDSSNYVAFQAPATVSSDVVWTLPDADAATSGYALVSDGAGTLSWAAAGATITQDNTSNTAFNLYYASTTTGALTGVKYDGGTLTFNPSTETLAISNVSATTVTTSGNATVGGALTVTGNLTVNGTTTTINSTTMTVDDLNITLASGAANAAAANGAGITVDGASATITYASTGDKWVFNKDGDFGANDVTATNFSGIASSAKYADLAEKYAVVEDIAPGTVVCFGGEAEVQVCDHDMDRKVAGVVSTDPAYMMNSSLENAVYVALTGRVPCKVVGPVRKGDMMVSAGNGAARAEENPVLGSVIGKALENFDGAEGVIEVVVGRL